VPRLCEFYPGIGLTNEEKSAEKPQSGQEKPQSGEGKPQSKYGIHITKNTHTLQNPHKHTHYKAHSYTYTRAHTHTHTHTHTLQNNTKQPQYKLKQNAYRKST